MSDAYIAMAEALNTNTSLTSLNLGYNAIDNERCIAIAEALNINTSLTMPV